MLNPAVPAFTGVMKKASDFFSEVSADVLPCEWPAVIKYTGH